MLSGRMFIESLSVTNHRPAVWLVSLFHSPPASDMRGCCGDDCPGDDDVTWYTLMRVVRWFKTAMMGLAAAGVKLGAANELWLPQTRVVTSSSPPASSRPQQTVSALLMLLLLFCFFFARGECLSLRPLRR